jgi:serine/threonine kinase PknH
VLEVAFGQYRSLSLISGGGMEEVWRARPATRLAAWIKLNRRTTLISILGVAVITAGLGITGCSHSDNQHDSSTSSSKPAASPGTSISAVPSGPAIPPVAEAELEGLLLTPEQINAAMGTSTLIVHLRDDKLASPSHHGRKLSDPQCLTVFETAPNADSGATAMRGQTLERAPDGLVGQAVAAFPSAQAATDYLNFTAQAWAACSNREVRMDEESKVMPWRLGASANAGGVLSISRVRGDGAMTLVKVLTVANNVVIDVGALHDDQRGPTPLPPDAAVNIARQIAAKVPTK